MSDTTRLPQTPRGAARLAFGILWLAPGAKLALGGALDRARYELMDQLTPEERRLGVKEAQDLLACRQETPGPERS